MLAAMVFLWWGMLTQGSFSDFTLVLSKSVTSLLQLASIEARSPAEQRIYGIGLQGPADILNIFTYYATAALAAAGVAFSVFKPKETKFEDEYRFLMIGCLILWILTVVTPTLSYALNSTQVLVFTLIILLPCIPLGASTIVRAFSLLSAALRRIGPTPLRRHEKPLFFGTLSRRIEPVQAIIVVLLILTIVTNTGLNYQLSGQPAAVLLNSRGQQYDTWYVHTQELASAGWLTSHNGADTVVSTDQYSVFRLGLATALLYPTLPPSYLLRPITDSPSNASGYYYSRYENVIDNTAIVSKQRLTAASQLYVPVANTSLRAGDKIYSNAGSDVYLLT
jgi:uncharacterized membrane protein